MKKKKLLAMLTSACLLMTVLAPAQGTFASEVEDTPAPTAAAEAAKTEEPKVEEVNAETEAPVETDTEKAATEEAQVEAPTEAPATEAPTAEPSAEAEMEPMAEPSVEATMEPTAEATEAPTEEPSVEPSAEPSVEPTMAVPESELSVKLSADCRYAFAGEGVGVSAEISGGIAPYAVRFTANGDVISAVEVAEAGGSYASAAAVAGGMKFGVTVTDASGAAVSDSVSIPVAVNETETAAEWEKSFKDVEMTGDWREDLLNIARTQLGYHESDVNFIIDDAGDRKGYTRYGDWYGAAYSDWCAMFIAFCLHYAEIPAADFPRDASCASWKGMLEARGAYEDDEDTYIPQSGDLIFFNHEGKATPEHIGIVESVSETSVATIEGNSASQVRRRSYDLKDYTIIGYGNIETLMRAADVWEDEEEAQDENVPAEIPTMAEAYDIPVGTMGYTTVDFVNIRAASNTSAAIIGETQTAGSEFEVIGAEVNTRDELWYKVVYGELTGYIISDYVELQGADTPQTLELGMDNFSVSDDASITLTADAWDGSSNEKLTITATLNGFEGADKYLFWNGEWQYRAYGAGDDAWTKVGNTQWIVANECSLEVDVQNLRGEYRFVMNKWLSKDYYSNVITFVEPEILKALNEMEKAEGSETTINVDMIGEIVARAKKAGSVNNIYSEEGVIRYARNGEVVANITELDGKQYVVDEETGLIIAWIDSTTGEIIPILTNTTGAETAE